MHELALADALLQQVTRIAAEQPEPVRVVEVEVEVGERMQVVPESLLTAWEAVCLDTPFQGAALRLVERKAQARCRRCAQTYEPPPADCRCPCCGVADPEWIAGDALLLKALECETDEEAARGAR